MELCRLLNRIQNIKDMASQNISEYDECFGKGMRIMKNMMKEYLENDYTENHLRNFCLYWMNASEGCGDEWRKKNDLDCLYFNGDLRADTLMSAWTPIKWVADCLNREYGINFYKRARDDEDRNCYLKLLAEDRDAYLPPKHELVLLLDRFLELAEQRCNYILLPERDMNSARYKTVIDGKEVWLFDEVPAMLSHLFDKDSLGRFFCDEEGRLNEEAVIRWIRREHLEMGFEDGKVCKCRVLPLIPGLDPYEPKWFTEEDEIYSALEYMVNFLRARMEVIRK